MCETIPPARVVRQSAERPRKRSIAVARPEVKNSAKAGVGRVRGIVGAVGIERRDPEQHGQAAAGDRGPLATDAEVDPPRPGAITLAVAVRPQRARLVEVDDGRLVPERAGARHLPGSWNSPSCAFQ